MIINIFTFSSFLSSLFFILFSVTNTPHLSTVCSSSSRSIPYFSFISSTTNSHRHPSTGSSNSQDSFPPAGSNSSSLDGFTNGPHVTGAPGVPGPYPQYPPSSEYGSHLPQRQPTQATAGKTSGHVLWPRWIQNESVCVCVYAVTSVRQVTCSSPHSK